MAAALREGMTGPVFIQGDHFQVNAKKYAADPTAELKAVEDLTAEAVKAGFYNIDVDTSTLVDLTKAGHEAQQELNGDLCASLTAFIRAREPKGVTVSVGGEIGEVGGKNSTPEELEAFMKVYLAALATRAKGAAGISKISIQTGTSHGGVPLPDGSIAQVKIDFDALERCSILARERYGMGGAVQHGASTLPAELFDRFPKLGACEIHLATEFQNMIYDHPEFPADFKRAIYERLRTAAADERKASDTDEQFFYKTRKKALGMFKRELWGMPAPVREAIGRSLEEKFTFLLTKLAVGGTQTMVRELVPFVPGAFPMGEAAPDREHEDVSGLAD
jgi:fructose/tagatose bisphosphate aldolase